MNSNDRAVSAVVGVVILLLLVMVIATSVLFAAHTFTENQPDQMVGGVTQDQASFLDRQVNLVSKGNADVVRVVSPLGTEYNLTQVGDSQSILPIVKEVEGVGSMQIIGEKDRERQVVTQKEYKSGVRPDIIVDKHGTGDYRTIQNAINNATEENVGHKINSSSPAVIVVERATYYENIEVSQNIFLIAEYGTVIADDNPNENVVEIVGNNSDFRNFIVEGDPVPNDGDYAKHGLVVKGDNVLVLGNEIRNASSPDLESAGVLVQGANTIIKHNDFRDNEISAKFGMRASAPVMCGNQLDSKVGGYINEEARRTLIRENYWRKGIPANLLNKITENETDTSSKFVRPASNFVPPGIAGNNSRAAKVFPGKQLLDTAESNSRCQIGISMVNAGNTSVDVTDINITINNRTTNLTVVTSLELNATGSNTDIDNNTAVCNCGGDNTYDPGDSITIANPSTSSSSDSSTGGNTVPQSDGRYPFAGTSSYSGGGGGGWGFGGIGGSSSYGGGASLWGVSSGSSTATASSIQTSNELTVQASPKEETTKTKDLDVVLGSKLTTVVTEEVVLEPVIEGAVGPLNYDWDFGDGETSSNRIARHVYDSPGDYKICLTVIDEGTGQSDTECIDIQVDEYDKDLTKINESQNIRDMIEDNPDGTGQVLYLENGTYSTLEDIDAQDLSIIGADEDVVLTSHLTIHSPGVTIKNVELQNGLTVLNNDFKLYDSTVYNSDGVGVEINANGGGFYIGQSKISARNGVYVSTDYDVSIKNNNISATDNYGIYLTSRMSGIDVIKNNITSPQYGIYRQHATDLYYSDNNIDAPTPIKEVVNHAPTIHSVSPEFNIAEVPVSLQANVTDQDGDAVKNVYWNIEGDSNLYKKDWGESLLYTFDSPGTYDVTIVAVDALGKQSQKTIPIEMNEMNVTVSGPQIDGTGEEVEITAGTNLPDYRVYSYNFKWGDGSSTLSATDTKTHTYSSVGDYTITVEIESDTGIVKTKTHTISIKEGVIPQFEAKTTPISVGEPVILNASESSSPRGGPFTYYWDLDNDGNTEKQGEAVTATFDKLGTHNVSLTVEDGTGVQETATKELEVSEFDTSLSIESQPIVSGHVENFTVSTTAPSSQFAGYQIDMGDGTTFDQVENKFSHTYTERGDYEIEVTAVSEQGYTNTVSKNITVDYILNPDFTISDITPNKNEPVRFNASLTNSTDDTLTYAWVFGDQSTTNGKIVNHTYTASGRYTITLTVTDEHGATATTDKEVFVTEESPDAYTETFENESGMSEWVVFDNYNIGRRTDRVYNGTYSYGITENGLKDKEDIAQAQMFNGTKQPTQITFHWTETGSSNSGGVHFRNGNNDTEVGFVTQNPQWNTYDTDGYTQIDSGIGYKDWVRTTLTFDWDNNKYYYTINNTDGGKVKKGSGTLRHGEGIESLYIRNPPGNDIHYWIDNISTDMTPFARAKTNMTEVRVNEPLKLNGSRSVGVGGRYEWDFDDGTTASGKVVNHKWSEPGTYNVEFTAMDKYGQADKKYITIRVKEGSYTESFEDGVGSWLDLTGGSALSQSDSRSQIGSYGGYMSTNHNRVVARDVMTNGSMKPTKFTFYYNEPSGSNSGGLSLINSNGKEEAGFYSANPEWKVIQQPFAFEDNNTGIFFDAQGDYTRWAESSDDGRMKYYVPVPSNNGEITVDLKYTANSFEGGGTAFYAVDSNGDKHYIDCRVTDSIDYDDISCSNTTSSDSFEMSGNYTISAPTTIERVYIASDMENNLNTFKDESRIYRLRIKTPSSTGWVKSFNGPEEGGDTFLNGVEQIYGGDGYDRWMKVELSFDWEDGTFGYKVTDPKSGTYRTGQGNLKYGTDLRAIEMINPDGTGKMWFDNITVSNATHAEIGRTIPIERNFRTSEGITLTSYPSYGRDLSYKWYWGDGTTSTGEKAYHSYDSEGSYQITLEVTSATGEVDTDTITVNVDGGNYHETFEQELYSWETPSLSRTTGSSYKGAYSGQVWGSGSRIIAEDKMYKGGKEISSLTYYYKESTKSSGGGLRITNSEGEYEVGFASDNPQWVLSDKEGLEYIFDGEYNGNEEYKDWHKVLLSFDWQRDTYSYRIENLDTGKVMKGTGSLRHGLDAENVTLEEYSGSWGGGGSNMWFDEIKEGTSDVVPQIYAPENANIGETIELDATTSTGDIQTYEWVFPDGTTKTGEETTYVFDQTGNYTVTLKITSSDGTTKTETKSIRVESMYDGFEQGFESWTVNTDKMTIDGEDYRDRASARVWGSSFSTGQVFAETTPFPTGERPEKFVGYYREVTDSSGGGLVFRDSQGEKVTSVYSDNPEWEIEGGPFIEIVDETDGLVTESDQGEFRFTELSDNDGRFKYKATAPANSGTLKVGVNFRGDSYEKSGFAVYGVDSNGNKHYVVCDSPILYDDVSCSDNIGGSYTIDDNFTISASSEIQSVYVVGELDSNRGGDWGRLYELSMWSDQGSRIYDTNNGGDGRQFYQGIQRIDSGTHYKHWIRVEANFHWEEGLVSYNITDTENGHTRHKTIEMDSSRDVSSIQLVGFGGSDTNMWFDDLQFQKRTEATYKTEHETLQVGEKMMFDGRQSVGTSPTFEWDFDGDGIIEATGLNPVYEYPTAGTYSPTLTVTDANGTVKTHTKQITVRDEPYVENFDDGEADSWTILDSLSIRSDRSYSGSYSIGETGSANRRMGTEVVYDDGKEIESFEFKYIETSNSGGGGIRLVNSKGQYEAGFATDNPQWMISGQKGLTEVKTSGDYKDWHHVELVFDWSTDTFWYRIEDLDDGDVRKGQAYMREGLDVRSIEISGFGGGWSGGSFNMWIDDIEFNKVGTRALVQAPNHTEVGKQVELSGKGSTGDGLSYEWDLDDDGSYEKTGDLITHAFSTGGNKTVTLKVTDSSGQTDTATKVVHVHDKLYGFDEGIDKWTVIDDSFTADSEYRVGLGMSAKAWRGSAHDIAKTTVYPDGAQPHRMVYYYREVGDSTGGGVRFRNSNGTYEAGFATDNPQWMVSGKGGLNKIYGGDDYNQWVRVEFVFDWDNDTYDYKIRNLATGTTKTGTEEMRVGKDISSIHIEEQNGGSWKTGNAYKMWVDRLYFDR